jgi:hypothetical protein
MVTWLANRYRQESGAIGYIILWALGVPASLLFVIFLLEAATDSGGNISLAIAARGRSLRDPT